MSDLPPDPAPQTARRRSAARLGAVQALYQLDFSDAPAASVVAEFVKHRLGREIDGDRYGEADPALFAAIVEGANARRGEVDRMIAAALSPDWTPQRLEVTLRAILRAGTYELLARADVPARVVLSEYLDLAHAFFEGKEPSLVNGVLNKIARTLRPGELEEGTGGRR